MRTGASTDGSELFCRARPSRWCFTRARTRMKNVTVYGGKPAGPVPKVGRELFTSPRQLWPELRLLGLSALGKGMGPLRPPADPCNKVVAGPKLQGGRHRKARLR